MFRCQSCGSTEFNLALQPGVEAQVAVRQNAHNDVVIEIGTQSFVADLAFMNQFALCTHCGHFQCWTYFYPDQPELSIMLLDNAEPSGLKHEGSDPQSIQTPQI